MTKDELFDIIKDNLTIQTNIVCLFPTKTLEISILFDGKKVCSAKQVIDRVC